MNRRFALLVLALAVVTVLWLSRPRERATTPVSTPGPAPVASVPDEGLRAPEAPTAAEVALPVDESSARRVPVAAPAAPARDPNQCEIRGRFLFASGEPAPGVELRYRWEKVYESAADGTFSILFENDDNPSLWAELEGYAGFKWEWFGPEPGQVIDVGDVVVERGGTLRVRIVDRQGRTLTQGWTVAARVVPRISLDGRDDDSRVVASSAGEDGTFVLEHVRSGRVHLEADSDIAGSIDGQMVSVRDGEVAEVEIRYDGHDLAKRILVNLELERFWWLELTPDVHLSAPGMEPRLAQATGRGSSFTFDDLQPGAYLVEIDDPRLLPWRADGVAPGTALNAEVKGSASLELRVLDEGTGAALEDYGAVLRFRDGHSTGAEFDLFEDGSGPSDGGVIDGILPGDFTLTVSAPGRAPAEVWIENLAPRECRRIVARLGKGAEIAGTLVRSNGQPVPHTIVTLLASDDWNEEHPIETETDEQGRFEFLCVAPRGYTVRAALSPFVTTTQGVVIDSGFRADVRLTLPSEANVVGRVLGPPGAAFEGMSIVLEAAAARESAGTELDSELPAYDVTDVPEGELAAALGPDGSFRIGAVRPGSYAVLLQLPQEVQLDSTTMFLPEARREIGRVTLGAGENPDRVLDAKPVWPGTLVVYARGDAALLAGAMLAFEGRDVGSTVSGAAGLSGDGEIRLFPLFPGRYGVVVGGPDAAWLVAAPGLCSLAAGGTARCEIDVVVASGELRVTEQDTREPAHGRSIFLVPRDPILETFGFLLPFDTDHNGVLRATLAPGTYAVLDSEGAFDPNDPNLPTVRWTAAGPDPAEVSIPRFDVDEDDSGD